MGIRVTLIRKGGDRTKNLETFRRLSIEKQSSFCSPMQLTSRRAFPPFSTAALSRGVGWFSSIAQIKCLARVIPLCGEPPSTVPMG